MKNFYHSSIKNYTIALLDLFNDISIPRYDSNGDRIEDISIPIKFGNRGTAYMISEHDLENIHSGNVYSLPRMALSFISMAKAPDRDTNKLHKINRSKLSSSEKLVYEYQYNAVAYDFEFTLYIATRTFTDATIIIEQIAPMFRPDISLKIQELDIQEHPTTVPVKLGDFNIELPEEMEEEEIRVIESEVSVTVHGNLYLPITNSEVIKEIDINIQLVDSNRTSKTDLYGIDTILPASKIEANREILDETVNLDKYREDTKTKVTHFSNSKDI